MRRTPLIPLAVAEARRKELRELLQASIVDYRKAIAVCRERHGFENDFLLAMAWVDANALAVNVKGNRGDWNDAMARGRVDALYGDCDFSLIAEVAASRR